MVRKRDQIKILTMTKSNPEITDRQKQILEELKECDDELTSQELHRQLHQCKNAMGLSTVYRNLQVLIKQGLVRSRHLPTGEVLYTSVERDIHHLTCVECGETKRLEVCPVKELKVPRKSSENFELLFHTLEFFGLCQNCLKRKNHKMVEKA